jgi:hypothetical protein
MRPYGSSQSAKIRNFVRQSSGAGRWPAAGCQPAFGFGSAALRGRLQAGVLQPPSPEWSLCLSIRRADSPPQASGLPHFESAQASGTR